MEATSAKFYDPLYEVVVFRLGERDEGPRTFFKRSHREALAFSEEEFSSLLNTYEFSRLNFLRQSGFAFLEFPSATHTRFAHSLGCWLLAEWASDYVIVVTEHAGRETERDPVRRANVEGKSKSDVRTLGEFLKTSGWIEEFQLALLFHDIGHFPFSHVIEDNDLLRNRYLNEEGIDLKHENVGCNLLLGHGTREYELFRDFVGSMKMREMDENRFVSARLAKFSNVDVNRIVYLLTGNPLLLEKMQGVGLSAEAMSIMPAVHELVSGVVDIDRIDHYNRDMLFITQMGKINVRGLLQNLALYFVKEDRRTATASKAKAQIMLAGDGVDHAFQMLYAMNQLTKTVFHNEHNMAYDIMLNHAINAHWNAESSGSPFRKYLPFLNDFQLFNHLETSSAAEVKWIAQRIMQRDPFECVGCFYVRDDMYKQLGDNRDSRRRTLADRFSDYLKTHNLGADQCFLKFDKNFGRPSEETEWLDVSQILAGAKQKLGELEDRREFVKFIKGMNNVASRRFWIFVSDSERMRQAKSIGDEISGKRISKRPRTETSQVGHTGARSSNKATEGA